MSATTEPAVPPYLIERDPSFDISGYIFSAYQSISFHPLVWHLSFEELRWQTYSISSEPFMPAKNGTPAQSVRPVHRMPQTESTFTENKTATPPLNPYHATSNDAMMVTSDKTPTQPVSSPSPVSWSSSVRDAPENHYKLDDTFITFLVGRSPQKKFLVHEGVLGTSSNFIRLALGGDWKAAGERAVQMPDDDPAVFSVYQSWLYTSMILTRSKSSTSEIDPEYKTLVQAYVLGEKIGDQNFKDCIADALVEKLDRIEWFDTSLAGVVFRGTPADSPLRKLWLDVYVHLGQDDWITSKSPSDSAGVEFLVAFSRCSMQQHRSAFSATWKMIKHKGCACHGHGAEPCYRQSRHGKR